MSLRLARLISSRPRLVLGFWMVLVILALPFATRVGDVFTNQPALEGASASAQVRRLLASNFEQQSGESVVLVTRSPDVRVGEPSFDHSYARMITAIEGIPGVIEIQDYRKRNGLPLVAPDHSYAITIIGIEAPSTEEGEAVTANIRRVLERNQSLEFNLSGGPATLQELEAIAERDARRAELFGLPLSLVVLTIAFGALVASAMPLLVAMTSITLSFAMLYLLGQWMDFAVFTQSIVTMLGLATGIDYALLLVNRFREELRRGLDPREAAEVTTRTAGKAVTFSGLTVAIALSALLVPPLSFVRSIGVGTMVVVLISVLVATTALPSSLALLGHRVNLLRVTSREPGTRSHGFWKRRAGLVMRRPWLWTIGGSLVLIVLALPALRMQLSDPGPLGLSAKTDARQVVAALEGVGLEGMLRSVDVLVDFGEVGFYRPTSQRLLSRFGRELEALEETEEIYSAMAIDALPRLMLYQYYATPEIAHGSELAELVRSTVSEDGRYSLLRVMPNGILSPAENAELVSGIRRVAQELGLRASIGGSAVFDAEWTEQLYRSFPLAVAMVYLATFLLLAVAFRSLLIPVKSIILNSLTVGAAFGVITLVFQEGVLAGLVGLQGGLGFVDSSAPLFIFAIVFGLSMDYEVFMVARIFESHRSGMSNDQAVSTAMSSTGGVITSAATIMIVVFSIFIFSEVVLIKTLGLGMAIAVLLDATLVRVALVPAVMSLAGRGNWWLPRPVARLADRIDLSHD